MSSSIPTNAPAFGTLTRSARLYIRLKGNASLHKKRTFLMDLEAGVFFPSLQCDRVEFELVAKELTADAPLFVQEEPQAKSVDKWIRAMARLPLAREGAPPAIQVAPGQTLTGTSGQRCSATEPAWLIAEGPSIRLEGANVANSRSLPVYGALLAVCREQVDIQVVDSQTFLDRFGANALSHVASEIAKVVQSWYLERLRSLEIRNAGANRKDDDRLREAHRGIAARRLDEEPALRRTTNPLLSAVEALVAPDGIEVHALGAEHSSDSLEDQLSRIALASRVRFRQVSLESDWWRNPSPPMLVWKGSANCPFTTRYRLGQCLLVDPLTNEEIAVDAEVAEEVLPNGFMVYPALPAVAVPSRLLHFILRHQGSELRLILGTTLLIVGLGLTVPVATGVVVGTAIPQGRHRLLLEMSAIVASAAAAVGMLHLVRTLATIRASASMIQRVQSGIMDHVLRLTPEPFRRFSTGDLAQRVLAAQEAEQALQGPVVGGVLSGLFAGVSFLVMLVYDRGLAIYGFCFALVTVTSFFVLALRRVRHLSDYRTAQGKVAAHMVDVLTGLPKLRIAAAEERVFVRWANFFHTQQRAQWRAGRLHATASVLAIVLPALGMLGMFYFAANRNHAIELGAFAAFSAAFAQFSASLSVFGVSLGLAAESIPLVRRAKPLLQASVEDEETRAAPGALSGRITVHDLSFRYSVDGPMALDGVSFEAEPGDCIAIVGPSGSGKSTLIRLLLGFETPLSGTIYYDGADLARLDLKLVRRQIGTVLQHSRLIPGSIYENISGAAFLSDEEVMDAARQAGVAEDIRAFPMGLETFVSEDLRSLSGGQRQRIMIARALAQKPSMFFFDEATSALDNKTQAIVAASLNRIHLTRLVIAHRLSTVRKADKILVVEQGRITESGRFDELMEKKGSFFRLAKRQLS